MRVNRDYVAIFLYALLIYYAAFDLSFIIPTNVDWLISDITDDKWVHYFGWAFYRQAPWDWPITKFTNYMYPFGEILSNVDCIPWLAILFKTLSPILPKSFQYFGIWHFLSFVLLGFYSRKIFYQFKLTPNQALIGGMVFMTNWSVIARHSHIALTAHWLILACLSRAISFYESKKYKRHFVVSVCILIFAMGVHPYLWFFCSLILGPSMMFEDNLIRRWTYVLSLVGFSLVTMKFLGISAMGFPAAGFDTYSADLLTFFDSRGSSKVLPALTYLPGSGEGFAFLGLSNMVLLTLVVYSILKKKLNSILQTPLHIYFLILFLLSFCLALGSTVRFGDLPILHLSIYDYTEPFPTIFRSPGRFVWIAQYILLISAWVYFSKVFLNTLGRRFKISMICFLILLPWFESNIFFREKFVQQSGNVKLELLPQNETFLNQWTQSFDAIYVYPLSDFEFSLRKNWMKWALENKKSIGMGRSARPNLDLLRQSRDDISKKVESGDLEKRSIYLVPINIANKTLKHQSTVKCLTEKFYSICLRK